MSAATFFPSDSSPDLYAVLSLSRDPTPTPSDIKQAYRRSALLYHPDKLSPTATPSEIEQGNLKFQQIGFAYGILKDEKKRERYDKTGSMDEEEVLRSEAEWKDYFKELWKGEVNADTIDEFREKYQGSEEELSDLLSSYTTTSGDLPLILSSIMCSSISDEPRFISLINDAIKSGKVEETKLWKKSSKDVKGREKRVKESKKEEKEAEEYARELGVHEKLFGNGANGTNGSGSGEKGKGKGGKKEKKADDQDGLRALIQGNQVKRMDAMMESLEAKYGNKSKKKDGAENGKGKRKVVEEPSEEEFARIQKSIEERRNSAGSGGTGSKKSRKSK